MKANSPLSPDAAPEIAEPAVPHLVVGIGASAGGLQALQELFDELPSTTGMSFVVVQHLSPDFKSMMVQLLGRRAAMVVQDAEDGVTPRPDTVYLLPPRKDIELRAGALRLRDRERASGTGLHMPIDQFFHSLAVEQGDQCAGVVLSGTGSDGSRGIVAIRQAGGLVLAQSPETAKFDGMPMAAQSTGLVDFEGSPAEIAGMLVRRAVPELGVALPGSSTVLQELFGVFRRETGIDLAKYKESTVSRRIQRRMQVTGQTSLQDYLAHTRFAQTELRQLRLEMLIGVSSFFRDAEVWDYLEQGGLTDLIQRHRERPFRAWVSACSTGEEAYTVAMALHEAFRELDEPPDYKIFATDVSEEAIRHASDGLYSEKALAEMKPKYVERYFDASETGFRVKRTLRERMTFAVHNLLTDPPFTKLSFVTCRNMLIYLKPEVQKYVLSRVQFGLMVGGLLMLGSSESVGDWALNLQARSTRFKIFESMGPASSAYLAGALPPPRPRAVASRGPLESLYHGVLRRFVPPGVATDERFEILHVFGDVQPFISFPQGQLSTNLLRMLPQAASVLVGSAARRLKQGSEDGVVVTGAALGPHGGGDIRLFSYERTPQGEPGYLVFFDARQEASDDVISVDQAADDRMQQLELELGITRQHLQTAVQDLEASNEELQATNEELVASNEELQSTNEELQSVNEELYTVNAEYQAKIGQLEELSDDLSDLLHSIHLGAIFLTHKLTIRRFNDVATRVVPLIPHDVGRHIRDLRWNIDYPGMVEDAQAALAGGMVSRTTPDSERRLWEVSIRRHVHDNGPPGLLMILADVTEVRGREQRLASQAALYDAAAQLAKVGIAVMDTEACTVDISDASRSVLGIGPNVVLDYASFLSMLNQPVDGYLGVDAVRLFETTRSQRRLRVVARPGGGPHQLIVAFQVLEEAVS